MSVLADTDVATTRSSYVPSARRAAVREAVELVVEGRADLALHSMRWHSDHLAGLSDSTITLEQAWADYERSLTGHLALALGHKLDASA